MVNSFIKKKLKFVYRVKKVNNIFKLHYKKKESKFFFVYDEWTYLINKVMKNKNVINDFLFFIKNFSNSIFGAKMFLVYFRLIMYCSKQFNFNFLRYLKRKKLKMLNHVRYNFVYFVYEIFFFFINSSRLKNKQNVGLVKKINLLFKIYKKFYFVTKYKNLIMLLKIKKNILLKFFALFRLSLMKKLYLYNKYFFYKKFSYKKIFYKKNTYRKFKAMVTLGNLVFHENKKYESNFLKLKSKYLLKLFLYKKNNVYISIKNKKKIKKVKYTLTSKNLLNKIAVLNDNRYYKDVLLQNYKRISLNFFFKLLKYFTGFYLQIVKKFYKKLKLIKYIYIENMFFGYLLNKYNLLFCRKKNKGNLKINDLMVYSKIVSLNYLTAEKKNMVFFFRKMFLEKKSKKLIKNYIYIKKTVNNIFSYVFNKEMNKVLFFCSLGQSGLKGPAKMSQVSSEYIGNYMAKKCREYKIKTLIMILNQKIGYFFRYFLRGFFGKHKKVKNYWKKKKRMRYNFMGIFKFYYSPAMAAIKVKNLVNLKKKVNDLKIIVKPKLRGAFMIPKRAHNGNRLKNAKRK